ncbi:MAG: hypothetical protein RBT75_10340, partial [Anaerolineae bacterium]|nr:hypothetical protein [Anaerolineae bacterium]
MSSNAKSLQDTPAGIRGEADRAKIVYSSEIRLQYYRIHEKMKVKSAVWVGAFQNGGENLKRPYRAQKKLIFGGGAKPHRQKSTKERHLYN